MSTPKYLPPRSNPLNPPEILRELRRVPVTKVKLWNHTEAWLATRHEDVRLILQDTRFSADVRRPGFPPTTPGQINGSPVISMGRLDDPRHAEIRRTMADYFLPSNIDTLRPKIERIVETQINRVLESTPPVDLYETFALAIPVESISTLLNIPPADRRLFVECSRIRGRHSTTREEFTSIGEQIDAASGRLLARAEKSGSPLLVRLKDEVQSGQLSHEEALAEIQTLITAGHATTAGAISIGALMLTLNPEWSHAMREDPEVARSSAEEVLRYHAPIHYGLFRIATEDVLIGETLISAGDGVVVSLASANRDESAFDSPDKFDIRRNEARRHVTFGHGIHKCLGQWLARAELEIALSGLATRIPTLRLAVPLQEISFTEDSHIFRVRKLPVTW